MKASIRKITKMAVSIIASVAFFGMLTEADSVINQILISGISIAVFYGCFKILDKMGGIEDVEA